LTARKGGQMTPKKRAQMEKILADRREESCDHITTLSTALIGQQVTVVLFCWFGGLINMTAKATVVKNDFSEVTVHLNAGWGKIRRYPGHYPCLLMPDIVED